MDAVAALAEQSKTLRLAAFKNMAECQEVFWRDECLLLVKPGTYMNNSGAAVSLLVRHCSLDASRQLLVAYDDLDLALGSVRLRAKGSAGTHNGMASVIEALGREDFARIRMGIGPKPADADAAEFVLSRFKPSEAPVVEKMIQKARGLLEAVVTQGVDLAISKYQTRN